MSVSSPVESHGCRAVSVNVVSDNFGPMRVIVMCVFDVIIWGGQQAQTSRRPDAIHSLSPLWKKNTASIGHYLTHSPVCLDSTVHGYRLFCDSANIFIIFRGLFICQISCIEFELHY